MYEKHMYPLGVRHLTVSHFASVPLVARYCCDEHGEQRWITILSVPLPLLHLTL